MPAPRHKGNLIDRLRSVRADLVKLAVYTADADEAREVAVPNVRQKWQRVLEVLDEVQWTRIEALDKKGSILLVHNRGAQDERPAGDLEELTGAAGKASEVSSLLGVAVHWVLRAQDVALTRQQEANQATMDAQNRIIESTMRRFEQMDNQYNEMLRLNHAMHGERFAQAERELRAARAAAADSEDSSSGKALEVLAPAFMKAILDKTPAAKPNGTPTPAPKKAGS